MISGGVEISIAEGREKIVNAYLLVVFFLLFFSFLFL